MPELNFGFLFQLVVEGVVAFVLLRVFLLYVLLSQRRYYTKFAAQYAGYVYVSYWKLRERLRHAFPQTLLFAIQHTQPEKLVKQLELYTGHCLERLPETDAYVLKKSAEIFALFIAACASEKPNEIATCGMRVNSLMVAINTAISLGVASAQQSALTRWTAEVILWMQVTEHLMPELLHEINPQVSKSGDDDV